MRADLAAEGVLVSASAPTEAAAEAARAPLPPLDLELAAQREARAVAKAEAAGRKVGWRNRVGGGVGRLASRPADSIRQRARVSHRAARVLSAVEQSVDILPGVRRQSRPVAGNTSRQMTRAAHAGAARRFGGVGDLLCGALPRPEPVVCA